MTVSTDVWVPLVAGFGGAVIGGALSFAGAVQSQRAAFAREARRSARLIYESLVEQAGLVLLPPEMRRDIGHVDQTVWRDHQGAIAALSRPEPFAKISSAYAAAESFVFMTQDADSEETLEEEWIREGLPPPQPLSEYLAETVAIMKVGVRCAAQIAGMKPSDAELSRLFETPFGDGASSNH